MAYDIVAKCWRKPFTKAAGKFIHDRASTIRLNFADRKMNNRHTQAGHIFKAALFFFRVKPLK